MFTAKDKRMEENNITKRVLVVDDQLDMRTMLGKLITKKLACEVQLADSADSALEIVREVSFNFIYYLVNVG